MSRAPGQWWARWRSTMRPWSPVLVREWHSVTDHEFERGCRMIEWQGVEKASRADDPDIEWGPYLGKEPDSIIGLDSLLDHHADAHDLPMVTIGGFMVARVSEDTPHTIKGEKLDQTRADIRSALESAGVLPAVEETPTP